MPHIRTSQGITPIIAASAYIDDSAVVIGDKTPLPQYIPKKTRTFRKIA